MNYEINRGISHQGRKQNLLEEVLREISTREYGGGFMGQIDCALNEIYGRPWLEFRGFKPFDSA